MLPDTVYAILKDSTLTQLKYDECFTHEVHVKLGDDCLLLLVRLEVKGVSLIAWHRRSARVIEQWCSVLFHSQATEQMAREMKEAET